MSIENSYNSWAGQYDTSVNKTRDLDINATIETLSNYSFKHVLELGCGTGKNTSRLLSNAEKIIWLDFYSGKISDIFHAEIIAQPLGTMARKHCTP
jgi:predicted TPR repeat methyltransferase